MNCVFGILKTKAGLKIKNDMLQWLKPKFNIIEVEQDPPGKLFEYPALKVLIDKCIQDNIPYLYIHTKGAANTTPVNGNVRKIWKHEFSTSRFNNYTKLLQSDIPLVICPWTGKTRRITWFNSWIINPKAAAILKKTFHLDSNRYYYEGMFMQLKEIVIKAVISDKCEWPKEVLSDVSRYVKEIK